MLRTRSAFVLPVVAVAALSVAGCGDQEPTVEGAGTTPVPATTPTGVPGTNPPVTPRDPSEPGAAPAPGEAATLVDAVQANAELKTFSTALTASGVVTALSGQGEFTVFAPNDDAFSKLGSQLNSLLQPSAKPELANLLQFHVVAGKYTSKQLTDGKLLTTLQGTRLRVEVNGDQVAVGNSRGDGQVVSLDLPASNGVVHVIDAVLQPKR